MNSFIKLFAVLRRARRKANEEERLKALQVRMSPGKPPLPYYAPVRKGWSDYAIDWEVAQFARALDRKDATPADLGFIAK